MMLTDLSHDEEKRLAAIKLLKADEHDRDQILEEMTALAGKMLGISTSFISILDDEKHYIKAACGLALQLKITRREDAFCLHTIATGDIVVCPDMRLDCRFKDNIYVQGAPHVRFYAGAPLRSRDGIIIGTLCLLDTQPNSLSHEQIASFRVLAGLISAFLEAWHNIGYIDAVTLLPNRQRLLTDLELMQKSGAIGRFRLILIYCIDMPYAYEIARSLGVEVIDDMLRDMACLLRLKLTSEGKLYAFATGRFALIMDDADAQQFEALNAQLSGLSAHISSQINIDMHISTGYVSFSPGWLAPTEILRRALSALHDAISRKTRTQAYEPADDERKKQDFRLINDLFPYLNGKPGLYLVFQPKIAMDNDRVTGVEALLRWQHAELGNITPDRFIPLLEKTTMMSPLTDWVINAALNQIELWSAQGIHLPVSINLSADDLSRPDFADILEHNMRQRGLTTSLLGVECLETEWILQSAEALNGLEMLKLRGFTISLDDFGTGYSNISYLRNMPMDIIKLDRSMIKALTTDRATQIIVSHVISMLKQLDYTVLAEGVEDRATFLALRALGCDEVQGYYHSPPLSADKLVIWLKNYLPYNHFISSVPTAGAANN
ncbi:EAL domain-containing protein [Acerihabitans sp. TG2]|uniref:sensor domain-containing diguanylate cyclase n=1 Tax=Acerihabitans sp. TG2 TaxID=3096008 RepID=UPI002B2242F8|nr:EAL domain-containing protein [Acerihabitans sp. TG2]MEA9391532.1 EAL domain-containing protein [Acerihabitans sp. TG2]